MSQDGGGPGGHPGVFLALLVGNSDLDKASLEAGFETGGKLEGIYTANDNTFAIFASGYK